MFLMLCSLGCVQVTDCMHQLTFFRHVITCVQYPIKIKLLANSEMLPHTTNWRIAFCSNVHTK